MYILIDKTENKAYHFTTSTKLAVFISVSTKTIYRLLKDVNFCNYKQYEIYISGTKNITVECPENSKIIDTSHRVETNECLKNIDIQDNEVKEQKTEQKRKLTIDEMVAINNEKMRLKKEQEIKKGS